MLKYANYDIVFQEYPDEVTLAINLTLCPNHCPGCHSPALWADQGEELNEASLGALIDHYDGAITCVGLMGGDNDPEAVLTLLQWVRRHYEGRLKTGWYSGRTWVPPVPKLTAALNFLKLGPYIASRGPLDKPTTNQRYFTVMPDGTLRDDTDRFKKKRPSSH